MKTITKSQELQLIGLFTLADHHNEALKDIERAACEITGQEPASGSHTSDAVYGGADYGSGEMLRDLLGKLDITVADAEITP